MLFEPLRSNEKISVPVPLLQKFFRFDSILARKKYFYSNEKLATFSSQNID